MNPEAPAVRREAEEDWNRSRRGRGDITPTGSETFTKMMGMVRLKVPDAQTTRNCRLEEIADGIVVNSQTKQRFTYSDPCVERGVTVAYQEEAHKASIQAVKEILRANLKLKLRLAPERALATLGALR
jgi:hypothetical protein